MGILKSFVYILLSCFYISCKTGSDDLSLQIFQLQVPVLANRQNNPVMTLEIFPKAKEEYAVSEISINLTGITNLEDIKVVRVFYTDKKTSLETANQFGNDLSPTETIVVKDHLSCLDTTYFSVSLQLRDEIDLSNQFIISCNHIKTNKGFLFPAKLPGKMMRTGMALRQHMDDNVHTYRIPGLAVTNSGTLLAIYDVRRESSRDLQGDIDIGLSRSTDGGNTWEPMRIVLDMKEWGGLPGKFNGVSDANILVDRTNNNIYVAGLWMHGVLDENGKWIEGLNAQSDVWEHQWSRKGSQPGFGVKETSQFLITKSTDDGQTWSEPVNLTRMCKKKEWWLWAPAPGNGIALDDGTLVFPTQGRDETGEPFSNITWSKDGGETWTTSNMASKATNENAIVQLNDGSIMLNARFGANRGNLSATNGRVISVSQDLGETWTEHVTSRSALIEPTCMASLHKHWYTENGEKKSILLFSNPNSKTTRDHMTIKVSFDDGATWPEEYWILLDELRGRGYSCLTSVDENTIGIIYEGSQADMTFQKISLAEILKVNAVP